MGFVLPELFYDYCGFKVDIKVKYQQAPG